MTDSIEFHYKALDETVQVVPFYFPGRADVWHERLGSGVLGNFWMEPVRIEFAGATHEFSCRLAFLLLLFFSFVLLLVVFCLCVVFVLVPGARISRASWFSLEANKTKNETIV